MIERFQFRPTGHEDDTNWSWPTLTFGAIAAALTALTLHWSIKTLGPLFVESKIEFKHSVALLALLLAARIVLHRRARHEPRRVPRERELA